MTRSDHESLDRLRDDFGRALVGAARGRERRRRAVALSTAGLASACVVLALALPPSGGSGGLGASPAAAAVRELTRSLREGVLVREATTTQRNGPRSEVVRERDWTDLATRDRRTRYSGPSADIELWNPSPTERFTLDRGLRAPDGRLVVTYARKGGGVENISSAASPVEEIEELLALAESGGLTLRREGGEVVLEQRQECFATPDRGTAECGGGGDWPGGGPAGLEPVVLYQTWWLSEGNEPRILRHENGSIAAGTTVRERQYRIVYERWEVLPATPENLALVDPPAFDPGRFLVLEGESTRDALREGRIVCRVRSCG